MSFLFSWLFAQSINLFFQLVDADCEKDAVYVTGPDDLTGVYKINTPGKDSGPAHGNKPIYESTGPGKQYYLYWTDSYWIFSEDLQGNSELYFCSSDGECPDEGTTWLAGNGTEAAELKIMQVSAEGTCPELYPWCYHGNCLIGDPKQLFGVHSRVLPLFATDPRVSMHPFTAIHGTTGNRDGPVCSQKYQACPKQYPICKEAPGDKKVCAIEECEVGIKGLFGMIPDRLHSACQAESTALTANTPPWRCTEPWRCLPAETSIPPYNYIEGFNGKDTPCQANYEVRRCPEREFPVCKDGNCWAEKCKNDGCGAEPIRTPITDPNQRYGYNGKGSSCTDDYQVKMCPESYPVCELGTLGKKICKTQDCAKRASVCGSEPIDYAPHWSTTGENFKMIDGYDAKGTECDEDYQALATCPELYPKCVEGNCMTADAQAAHPVWALYRDTLLDECIPWSGQQCNAIHGYDTMGAKCDQNYKACPVLYPYCHENRDCLVAECRGEDVCSHLTGFASGPTVKPIGNRGIKGYDGNAEHTCVDDYEIRRCPKIYPSCHEGNCVIGSCKGGVDENDAPCEWRNGFVNPLNPRIPDPDPATNGFNRILGSDGLGNMCNEAFEVECPPTYPICGRAGSGFEGNCVIARCEKGLFGESPCDDWRTAESPTGELTDAPARLADGAWDKGKNRLAGTGHTIIEEGKPAKPQTCTMNFKVAMCPFHYPRCFLEGEHEGDCTADRAPDPAWVDSEKASNTGLPEGTKWIHGIDASDASGSILCNTDHEETIVKLLASEQDLLYWLSGKTKAWHTSLEIGDTEYWYDPEGGGTLKQEPAGRYSSHLDVRSGLVPKREAGFAPGDSDHIKIYKINLGPTSKHIQVLKSELEDLFIFPDSGYDVIYRNSNTFTDFALWHLLGYRLSSRWARDLDLDGRLGPSGWDREKSVEKLRLPKFRTRMDFMEAESKVLSGENTKDEGVPSYAKTVELFSLLGKNLEGERWSDMYICPSAKKEVKDAWDAPVTMKQKGYRVVDGMNALEVLPDQYHLKVETIDDRNVLARGGVNEHTQADSVVPVDLRSFLKLVDLLMANCISLLYDEQVKLAEKWHGIDQKEEFNMLSALGVADQRLRTIEHSTGWIGKDRRFKDKFGERSHQSYAPIGRKDLDKNAEVEMSLRFDAKPK